MIRQEYREPVTKQVTTHAMGGGTYRKLTQDKDDKGRIRLSVQTGESKQGLNSPGSQLHPQPRRRCDSGSCQRLHW